MARPSRLVGSVLALFCSACCFGDLAPPPAPGYDDAAMEQAARELVEREAVALTAAPDGGSAGGGCGAGHLAMALGVAVVTRGHAGSDMMGSVSFSPSGCAARVLVFVALVGGAWQALGAQLVEGTTAVSEVGVIPFFEPGEVEPPPDIDLGSDELFD
jgi:hypothetical protein